MRVLLCRAMLMLALINLTGFSKIAQAADHDRDKTEVSSTCCDKDCKCHEGGECTCENCGCSEEGCNCAEGGCCQGSNCGQGGCNGGSCDPNQSGGCGCGCGCCGGGGCKPEDE